jgi:hypothetical protein
MNYLITYANQKYRYNQLINKKTAEKLNFFDEFYTFHPRKLEKAFFEKYHDIAIQDRGGGYWIWKPYIILKTLATTKEGDILFYCDSGSIFLKSVEPLCQLLNQYSQDIIPFEIACLEKYYTKRDAFILMDCDSPKFTETRQRITTFVIIKNTKFSRDFVEEWFKFAQDARILTDIPNTQGQPNYSGFVGNRHDQSIYSLLTKKYDLVGFRDPSQWGVPLIPDYPNSTYEQIMDHIRHQQNPKTRFWLLRQLYNLSQKLEDEHIGR